MSQPKNVPYDIGYTNSRTFKKIRVDFPGAVGVGAAALLLDYAACQPEHEFYYDDLDFLSKDFDVSLKILQDIVVSYDIFEIYEKSSQKVVSPFINKQLQPYYKAVEDGKKGAEISKTKREIEHKKQLLKLQKQLSELDSTEGSIEDTNSSPIPYNKDNQSNKLKELKKSLSSSDQKIFKTVSTFREHYINSYPGLKFKTKDIGWSTETEFVIGPDGYLINTVSKKLLSREDALKVWEYVYQYNLIHAAKKGV